MKTLLRSFFAWFLFLIVVSIKLKAQIIENADFELWSGNCPYNVAPIGWSNYSTNLGPDKAGLCTGTVLPYSGSAHMNLVWYSSTGLIEGAYQAVPGFLVGMNYELTFQAINNQGLYSFGDPVFCEVYVNGMVNFTTPELYNGGSWTAYSTNFVATNDTMIIGFKVKNGLSGTSGSLGIDAVGFANLTPNTYKFIEQSIVINPCPIQDVMEINISNRNFKQCSLTLFDAIGNLIFEEFIPNINLPLKVNISTLPVGIYVAQINIDGQLHNKKIIKL
ncbi:MAG TPA: T9SS type A sorting domain-containing protein [Bacteroidia bacterium]|nr:T9SS type A sorting domain-containing protein [Bacteroidia bacterium]